MVQELYQALQGEQYIVCPEKLDPDSGIEWDELPRIRRIISGSSDASGSTDIQVMKFFTRQHNIKPAGMFELFSSYCNDDPDIIRENLMQYIYDNCKDVETLTKHCLPTSVSLGNWLLRMNHKRNAGDEVALFLLCKMFNRHAVVIMKTGLWSTLCDTAGKGELEIRAKCDICLVLIGKGNTGYGEVVRVTPTRTTTKQKKQEKSKNISLQQAVCDENNDYVMPNHHSKRKCKRVTASINKMNILPESGKSHNTRTSNGMRTRHTSRQLRRTFKDMNYKDLDVKPEEDVSPTRKCKREPSIAKQLLTLSFP